MKGWHYILAALVLVAFAVVGVVMIWRAIAAHVM